MKAIYWVIGVTVVAVGVFIFLLLGDTQKTIPKIQLSYFVDEKEIAESIQKRLDQEISKSNSFWIGLEPGRDEQLEVALQLKQQLEKSAPFQTVILDQELNLRKEWVEKFKVVETIGIKENFQSVVALLADMEQKNQRYLVITASIYATPLIKKNQIHQMKEIKPIQPMTFSFAFFPVRSELESSMLFGCNTEDHAGVSDWGCAVANKARFVRRKISEKNPKPWIGIMDLIGEKDYMLMLYRK